MTAVAAGRAVAPDGISPWRILLSDFRTDPLALGALGALVVLILGGLFCWLIAPQNPYDLAQLDIFDGGLPPGSGGGSGLTFLLGSDDQGRDMFSAMLYGLRTSILIGVSATAIALAIGVSAGLFAAYAGGVVDAAVMRLVDLQLSLPAILLALILVATLGDGQAKIIIALTAVQWAYYARTV